MKHKSATITITNEKFEKLFEDQLKMLNVLHYSEYIVEYVALQKFPMKERMETIPIPKGNLPFLAVIPFTYRSVYDQMNSIFPTGRKGYTAINCNEFVDVVDTPKEPYFIINVDYGKFRVGKSSHFAAKTIERGNRLVLTACEIISFALFEKQPLGHSLYANGSRYINMKRVIGLHYNSRINRSPTLGWQFLANIANERLVSSPSCDARFQWRFP